MSSSSLRAAAMPLVLPGLAWLAVVRDWLAEGGCYLAIMLAAVFFNPLSATIFEPDKVRLVRICAAAVAVLVAPLAAHRLRQASWPPVLWASGFVVLSFIASAFASIDQNISVWGEATRLQGLLTELSYLAIAGAVVLTADLRRLLPVLAWSSAPVCMYALIQHYGLDPLGWNASAIARPFAMLGNPDFLSSYLVMMLPITVYLALRHLEALPLAIVQASVLWMANGRSGFLALVMAVFVVAYVHPGARRWLLVALGPIMLASAVFLPGLISHRSQSIQSREVIWARVAQLVPTRPLLGYGPETLQETFLAPVPTDGAQTADRSHDSLLDVLYERGLIGLAASGTLIFVAAVAAWRNRTNLAVLAIGGALLAHLFDSLASISPTATQLDAYVLLAALFLAIRQREAFA